MPFFTGQTLVHSTPKSTPAKPPLSLRCTSVASHLLSRSIDKRRWLAEMIFRGLPSLTVL